MFYRYCIFSVLFCFFFFQAEDGIRDYKVTGVHTCALPIYQVGVSAIFGSFDYDRNRDRELLFENAVFRGESRNLLLNAHWSFTPNPRVFWQTRLFALKTSFKNVNRDELILNDGDRSQVGVRSDVSFQLPYTNRLEAGLYVRSLHADSFSQRFSFANVPFDFGTFDENGTEQSYYAQDTWTNERLRLQLTGGLRVEHSG